MEIVSKSPERVDMDEDVPLTITLTDTAADTRFAPCFYLHNTYQEAYVHAYGREVARDRPRPHTERRYIAWTLRRMLVDYDPRTSFTNVHMYARPSIRVHSRTCYCRSTQRVLSLSDTDMCAMLHRAIAECVTADDDTCE